MSEWPDQTREQRVNYADLASGDEVEIYVCDSATVWNWEKRTVVDVQWPTIRFRGPHGEYDIDAEGRSRMMRRPGISLNR